MITCWMCSTETSISDTDFGEHICPSCGVMIDVFNPEKPDFKPEVKPMTTQEEWLIKRETEQREEKVIPQGTGGGSQYNPFISLPNPNENKEGEIKIGEGVEIIDEFAPSENPKIKNPLIGNVKLSNGQLRTVGLNWGSYYNISSVLGKDTSLWVGKTIKYEGLKKSTKGAYGHRWAA